MEDQFSLDGRTALVTGASRGIGYAIAHEFIRRGARVIITARGEEALQDAARSLGPNAIAKRCDNADPADIARVVRESWRLSPIDILVNNAAISPYYKRAEQVSVEEWDSVVDVNLRGAYFCTVEVARRALEADRPAAVVMVASVGGLVPLERLAVYSTTKAGVIQMARTLALEWAAKGIRVNVIAPGWTETDFTGGLFASRWGDKLLADIPMGRYAAAEEIAGAAVFLASDASRYVTGAVLAVDGGRSLR